MSKDPVICFGQQPCGLFPRRFLYAKFQTARRLQQRIGGRIVFFYHDSDHDHRETQCTIRPQADADAAVINFNYNNKIQRKYTPLYLKQIAADWASTTARQLHPLVGDTLAAAITGIGADNPADFCLEMYRHCGLLEDVDVVRSSDPVLRARAIEVEDYYVDLSYKNEIVRARLHDGRPMLFRGGGTWSEIPEQAYGRAQISPTRDTRLRWMQSVIGCTHYICGAGEKAYLHMDETPEVTFLLREEIERSAEAWIPDL